MSESTSGRWCENEVWQGGIDDEPAGFVSCGGELRHVRRLEGEVIVTYLRCQICGHKTKMMDCHAETMKIRTYSLEAL